MEGLIMELSRYWEMLAVTSILPFASLIALMLRRDIMKGKVKMIFMLFGLAMLTYAICMDLSDHMNEIGYTEVVVASGAALITYLVLSFAHKHNEEKADVKGIALAEFVHSLLDGAVIGMAYFVNPLLGWGTALAIITHEAPKILGTVVLIRSLTTNLWDAVKYSALCQAGVPLAAVLFYTFGKSVSEEWGHRLEIAATATLIVIICRVAYHSFTHRGHN